MFKNRVRLPFFLSAPQFPSERSIFTKSDGSSKVLSVFIKKTYQGKTDQIPEDWHRKLIIALSHDEVTIEDNRFLSDVVLDSNYEIEWEEFLNKPIASSKFTFSVTPFNLSNSNCKSCDEISQLSLVDDVIDTVFEAGTTNTLPTVLDNDSICCYPITVSIVYYNTTFFDSVSVNDAGIITFKVKASVPVINNLLLATYRVTCPNGDYDEADVFVNITGSSTECVPVTNILPIITPSDGSKYGFAWDEPSPAPSGGYDWELYLQSDLLTPVQSGNVPSGTDNLLITGLSDDTDYIFIIYSHCSGGLSLGVQYSFTTPITTDQCGRFLVTYYPILTSPPQSLSYMDCAGVIQNYTFTGASTKKLCMLMNNITNVPIYAATGTSDITITYFNEC